MQERDQAELRHSVGDRPSGQPGLGWQRGLRARHLAGVQAGPQDCQVHRAADQLYRRPGGLVPRAGARHRREDDQHVHLRGEELHLLPEPDQAGLQESDLAGVPGGSRHQLRGQDRSQADPGEAAQEEMSPA